MHCWRDDPEGKFLWPVVGAGTLKRLLTSQLTLICFSWRERESIFLSECSLWWLWLSVRTQWAEESSSTLSRPIISHVQKSEWECAANERRRPSSQSKPAGFQQIGQDRPISLIFPSFFSYLDTWQLAAQTVSLWTHIQSIDTSMLVSIFSLFWE